MKKILKSIILLCLFSISLESKAYDSKYLSKALLSVFGGQCKSLGTYSQDALKQSQTLAAMMESLIKDNNCGEAQELVSSIRAFNINLSANITSPEAAEVMSLEKNIQELSMALEDLEGSVDPADVILSSNIASKLSFARLQLITAQADLQTSNNLRDSDRRIEGYYYVQEGMNRLMKKMPNLQYCTNNIRNSVTEVAGGILSTASFFANPAMGAAMSGAAGVIMSAANAIYLIAERAKLKQLDDVNLPTALSCSAEVLTNMYCETIRAEKLITKYANLEEDNAPEWKGIPFVFRKLPPLIDWLEEVRAGSIASDSFDAQRRLEIMGQDSFLNELKQRLDGFISDTDREMKTLNIELSNYILTKIEFLSIQLLQSKPLETLNGRDFLPFRALGFKEIPNCSFQGQIQPCPNLSTFKTFYNNGGTLGYKFSLTDWINAKNNVNIIYKEGREFVNQQLSRILNEDRDTVLAKAFEGYEGRLPSYYILNDLYAYAQEVKLYLINNNTDKQYSPQILNIESTLEMVSKVQNILKKWKDERDFGSFGSFDAVNDSAGMLLGDIYSTLNLRTGQRFLLDRIKSIVRWDIIARIKNGDFDAQLGELVRFNNINIISDITSYNLFNYQDMINDIDNAKGVLQATINTYFVKMGHANYSAFKLIEENKLEPRLKNKLCIHMLANDELGSGLRSKEILKACRGTVLKSVFKNSNIEVKFNDHVNSDGTFRTDLETRMCLYNIFMRQAKIREQFKD